MSAIAPSLLVSVHGPCCDVPSRRPSLLFPRCCWAGFMTHRRLNSPPGSRFTTCGGRSYFSHPHHRDATMSGTKSLWVVSDEAECHVFCVVEQQQPTTVALSDQVWAVAGDVTRPFGTRGEVLARFFPPQSGSTEWHGHPVGKGSPGTVKTAPPAVIAAWESSGLVTRALAKKLRKQVI